ncbi:MAG: tetratricopeptide repeat protein [Clostridiales bacterium]|nr:tetratricopeptide repeat protein [Clostridiales bacterium]
MNRMKVFYYGSILAVVACVIVGVVMMVSMSNQLKAETVKGLYHDAMQIADDYYERGDYEGAARYYRTASTKCPKEDDCYIGCAMSMLMYGDKDGALSILETGLSQADDTSGIEALIRRIENGEFDEMEQETEVQSDDGTDAPSEETAGEAGVQVIDAAD